MLDRKVGLDIVEIAKPELNATLVAEGVAEQLVKRASFRRTMKRAIQQTMERGRQGHQARGRRPPRRRRDRAHREADPRARSRSRRCKADIDYGTATAKTTYGTIGVKCWVYTRHARRRAEPVRQEAV